MMLRFEVFRGSVSVLKSFLQIIESDLFPNACLKDERQKDE